MQFKKETKGENISKRSKRRSIPWDFMTEMSRDDRGTSTA